MTGPGFLPGEMRWEVVLEPASGDGPLTAVDLDRATRRLPAGVDVDLMLCEVGDFDACAVGDLGRRLVGCRVAFRVRGSLAAAREFRETVERARSEHVHVEAGRLAGGAG